MFSVDSIMNYFKSDNRNVPKETIYNYLEYMCKALLIRKCERYDIRGKRLLTGKYKYYLTDLGIGCVVSSTKKLQIGAYIENVVYNELVSQGYKVNIGNLINGLYDYDYLNKLISSKEFFIRLLYDCLKFDICLQICYTLTNNKGVYTQFF